MHICYICFCYTNNPNKSDEELFYFAHYWSIVLPHNVTGAYSDHELDEAFGNCDNLQAASSNNNS